MYDLQIIILLFILLAVVVVVGIVRYVHQRHIDYLKTQGNVL